MDWIGLGEGLEWGGVHTWRGAWADVAWRGTWAGQDRTGRGRVGRYLMRYPSILELIYERERERDRKGVNMAFIHSQEK